MKTLITFKKLHIDIETYSSIDIKLGVKKYVAAPDFDILLFGYAYNDEPVKVVDLARGETLPSKIIEDLRNPEILKKAFNAGFEVTCINKYLERYYPVKEYTPIEQWKCTAMHSRYLNLPHSLDNLASIWKHEKKKDGKVLIRYFCVPCKPTKVNGGRTRNLPEHDLEKWGKFKEYCSHDVWLERELGKPLERYPVPEEEWDNFYLDYKINNNGFKVHIELADLAIKVDDRYKKNMIDKANDVGVTNPNSVPQLKSAINNAQQDFMVNDLKADTVKEALTQNLHEDTRTLLEVRQALSNTSIKKFQKMIDCNVGGFVYNSIYHYGAGTGRSAGRGVQPQNFARPKLSSEEIEAERNLLYKLETKPKSLKSLLRSMIIPDKDFFVISDFSAIEARVLAWLANEQWRLQSFASGEDIYIASYSKMFDTPIKSVTKDMRQIGKTAELALGYGGGKGAIFNFTDKFSEDEAEALKVKWRLANRRIERYWWECQGAFNNALVDPFNGYQVGKCIFYYDKIFLTITLPSGRKLFYFRPGVENNDLYYRAWGTTRIEKIKLYGGKIVENITQAVARDLLFEKLQQLKDLNIVLHVHDEVVIDVSNDEKQTIYDKVETVMKQESHKHKGLPLNCSTEIARYYKK